MDKRTTIFGIKMRFETKLKIKNVSSKNTLFRGAGNFLENIFGICKRICFSTIQFFVIIIIIALLVHYYAIDYYVNYYRVSNIKEIGQSYDARLEQYLSVILLHSAPA